VVTISLGDYSNIIHDVTITNRGVEIRERFMGNVEVIGSAEKVIIESGVKIMRVGWDMKRGIIDMEGGAEIYIAVGYDMRGGTINIKSGAIVDDVGYDMRDGIINIEKGVIVVDKNIDSKEDLESDGINQNAVKKGLIKFVS
jgi:hypothetical protein